MSVALAIIFGVLSLVLAVYGAIVTVMWWVVSTEFRTLTDEIFEMDGRPAVQQKGDIRDAPW